MAMFDLSQGGVRAAVPSGAEPSGSPDSGRWWAALHHEPLRGSVALAAEEGWTLEESTTSPILKPVSGSNRALPLVIVALAALVGFGFAGRLFGGGPWTAAQARTRSPGAVEAPDGRQGAAPWTGTGAGSLPLDALVSDAVRPDSLSAAAWEALYGPTAASWGIWTSPHSLSGAEWEALYGPTAGSWGIWTSPPSRERSGAPKEVWR